MMMNTEVFVCYVPGMLVHENSGIMGAFKSNRNLSIHIYILIISGT